MTDKVKELRVFLFGRERLIGSFPTSIHNDIRTTILMLERGLVGKGRKVNISEERIARAGEALVAGGVVGGVEALREKIRTWMKEQQWGEQDIEGHYDEKRSGGYHEHNKGCQERLTRRAAELGGFGLPQTPHTPQISQTEHNRPQLVLDLACGSGLSSVALIKTKSAKFVIGMDLSKPMLDTAVAQTNDDDDDKAASQWIDYIKADMSQPLPFRQDVFDTAVSISALHYLVRDAPATEQPALTTLFTDLNRCITPASPFGCVFQFFPATSVVPQVMEHVASECGFSASLVCDHTHHTAAQRWYLHLATSASATPRKQISCALFYPNHVHCALSLQESLPTGTPGQPQLCLEHNDWLLTAHFKHARWLVRALRHETEHSTNKEHSAEGNHQPSTDSQPRKRQKQWHSAALDEQQSTLAKALSQHCVTDTMTLDDMKGKKEEVWKAMVPFLHK